MWCVSIPSLNLLVTNITFSGTVFYLNSAVIGGSAIYITVQEDRRRTLKYRSDIHVRIVNELFCCNGKEDKGATFNNINLYMGSIIDNLLTFVEGGNYDHNLGSVIVATRSYITMSGNVHFI